VKSLVRVFENSRVKQRVAVCCSVLQCIAVYCSVLQCVAVKSLVLVFENSRECLGLVKMSRKDTLTCENVWEGHIENSGVKS